ncbi:MAG: hypothetical protein ACRDMZ_09395, partial [Solirubrobacteraceae bacterium]
DFLRAVFGSKRAPLNYPGYRSARFDELAAVTAGTTDPNTRRETVRAQIGLLQRDVPVVPLFFQEGAFIYRPQVYAGWVNSPISGILNKRSFLGHALRPVVGGASAPATATPVRATDGSGFGAAGYVALALLACIVLAILGGYVKRLRSR